MSRLIELHNFLKARYPGFTGVTKPREGSAFATWVSPPSKEDETAVQAIIDGWDFTEPAPPTDVEIKDRLGRLTTEQKDTLLAALIEQTVLSNPALLDKVTASVRNNR